MRSKLLGAAAVRFIPASVAWNYILVVIGDDGTNDRYGFVTREAALKDRDHNARLRGVKSATVIDRQGDIVS